MTSLIRKLVKFVWIDPAGAEKLGGLQADALKNFKTSCNTLSVFRVPENDNLSIEHIVAAVAARLDRLENIEYAVFDAAILDEHAIKSSEVKGKTLDARVNDLHVDLADLTAVQICAIAKSIQQHGDLRRLYKDDVCKFLADSIRNGAIDLGDLKERVRNEVIPYVSQDE